MKRKLLFAIVALLCSVGTWAGDVKRDVTSLLTNTTFDSNITGWTSDGFEWHASNGEQYSTGFAQKWADQIREGSISQTISNLPAGSYRMTAKCIGGTKEAEGSNEYDYLYATRENGGTTKADVEWVSLDKANERTLDFNNAAKQNVTVGFKANRTKWWSAIDDVKLYAMDLASASYDLPNTVVTAGTWYKFTTGSSSDAYTLSSSGNATITYTTDGTLADDAGISTTWTLTAKQNVLLAPSTTYYIKSDAAVTLTKTESSVSSSCVTGWTKVTSLSELQTNPEDYFFAIYSANNTGLMVETKSSGVPYYLTATSPSSTYYLYEIGNYTYNAESYFVMKSCGTSGYFHPVSGNAYDLQALSSRSVADEDCRLTFEVANNGIWNIKTWAVWDSGSYLGLWTPSNGYVNGQNMAGNKTGAAKGSFLIYRIAKSNINLTGSITNPDFENATWDTGWTGTGTDKDKAFAKQSGNGSFSGNFAEMWVRNTTMSAGNIYQTLSKLPAGVYTLSAKVQAGLPSKLYARIDAEEQYIECSSPAKTETLTFLVSETSDVTIGLKHDGVASVSGDVWIAVDDFALTYVEPLADSDDYDALNLAIEAANAKTLGFEVGEYAPYNNVDAISKLASAKAINQSAVNTKSTITSATTALASATWTANVGEVNAIYWEDYTSGDIAGDGYIHPLGWTNTGYNTRIYSAVAGNKDTNDGISAVNNLAMMSKYNTTYGETTGYTMPLKAATIYKITFKYCGWGNTPTTNVVLTDPESNAITLAPGFRPATNNGNTNAENWYSYTGYFVSTTAGNYTLALNKVESGQKQIGIGDIDIRTASALEFLETGSRAYAAGTYPSVTLARTISANTWSTFVVPFDIDNATLKAQFGDDVEVSKFSTNDKTGVTFTPMAEPAITANKPVLVRVSSAKNNFSFDGVTIVAGTPTISENGVNFVGNYDGDISIPNTLDTYFVKDNTIKKSTGTQKLKGFRAYFTVDAESPVKAFFENGIIFDNLATGIGFTPDSSLSKNGAEIFNLAGQRMNKVQRGVNIVNGKKVLVK